MNERPRIFKQDQEALKALINKSNSYTKRQQVQKRILIGSICAVVIIFFGGLYLYQVITTSGSDYTGQQLAADQASRVVREPEIIIQKDLSQQQVLVASQKIAIPKKKEKDTIVAVPVKKIEKRIAPAKKQQITIVRNKKEDPTDQLLQRAYDAFIDGDYVQSKDLYQKVLLQQPKNRDGILGLAAVAIKDQRYEAAKQKYQQLLYMDPKDSIARAGISSLQSRIDPALNESKLKFMLREQPEAAHLYFALGSLYVPQKRWADAQSAFFSAWSAENTNPDYAFNLAVSLDHLNQYKEARKFYQLSLTLSPASGGNFSKSDVMNRIKAIEEQK